MRVYVLVLLSSWNFPLSAFSQSLVQETNKYRRSLETLVHGGGGKVVGIGAGGIAFADALAKIGETNLAKNSGSIPALQPSEDHLGDLKVRS